ncbi:MAG: M10 family metallopeptidase C-terminal domain-containing protein [Alphaproteobacteria bacterium]|nr:M10 family metallopeptidase C-terminal domain-containing protein [Alphaproteobacteria bacterium]
MPDIAANTTTEGVVENGVYQGQLETSGDIDWVAVELTAGTTYTIRVLGTDSDNGNAQYLQILNMYDPVGNRTDHTPEEYYTIRHAKGYTTTEAQTEITPAISGTYYISIDGWGVDTGSYTVFVTQDQVGGSDNDLLTGTSDHDSLQGGCGDDTLVGGDGNDYLVGEWGDDLLTGGEGADTFRFYSDDWDDIRDGVADIWGNDTISDFDPTEDTLHFGGTIISRLEDFTITESGGNTTLTTSWGDSVTLLDVSADELSDANIRYRRGVRIFGANEDGGDGNDTLSGSDDDDILYGNGGDDVIFGNDGHDYLRGFDGDDNISGGDGVDVIGGEDGDDTISGGAGDDYILSNDGADVVSGDAGNDLIETGLGNDTLSGGTGDDTLRPGRGDDQMTGGTGADVFVIGRSWGDDTITDFNAAKDILDFQGSGLDIADMTFSQSGNNTVITDGTNTLTLLNVDRNDFVDAADDLILEQGSVTSHYTEYGSVDTIGDPNDDGILEITGIINSGGARWTPDEDGISRVSYSFQPHNWLTDTDSDDTWWSDAIEPITPYAQYLVELEIARIESYTNLDLVWVEDYAESAGNIRLSYHEFVVGGASSIPYEGPYSGDVFVGTAVGEDFIGDYFIHELGHSLGFNDLATWNEYTGEDYTIMSYVKSGRYEDAEHGTNTTTYMWADLAGLQFLYGVDETSTAGNNVFTYDLSAKFLETIFDAGGIDTIQVTGTGDAVHIDLTPGAWSDIGPDIVYEWYVDGQQNVAIEPGRLLIMPNTIIENAKGSIGDDTLTGNDADNVLTGFAGNDLFFGGLGNDTVWAGAGDAGNDSLFGGAGSDILAGGAGGDLIVGQTGNDTGFGGSGDDTMVGGDWVDNAPTTSESTGNSMWAGDGDDLVYGANGIDNLGGGLGNDTIDGAGGNDKIYAGKSGSDNLNGGNGNDVVFGGTENDVVRGGNGNDELYGGTDNDTVYGDGGNDTLYGGAGNDLLNGGAGDDFLYPGAGSDTLAFSGDHGDDQVSGFSIDEDTLDLSGTKTDFTSLADIQNASTETTVDGTSGVLIDTGDGNSIFLAGLSLGDLANLQFID